MQSTSTDTTTANSESARPTVTLADIQCQISSLFTTARNTDTVSRVSQTEYLQIYTSVCNFGMASKAKKTDAWNRQGKALFIWLDAEIRTHTRIIRDRIFGVQSEEVDGVTVAIDVAREVLNKYIACDTSFEKLSSLVGNLLGFWDRHWVRRERDEKKTRVGSVQEMHRLIWKEEVLGVRGGGEVEGSGIKRLIDAMTKLREAEGGGEELDQKLVGDVVESLPSLGVTLQT